MRLLLLILFLSVSAAGEEILFDRAMSAGTVYECSFDSKQSTQFSLDLSGKEKPAIQQETLQVTLAGLLQPEKIGPSGFPDRFRFQIRFFSGSLNGSPVSTVGLKNLILTVKNIDGKMGFTIAGKPLSVDQTKLLQSLFRPSSGRLSDLTGPRRSLKNGEMFRPNMKKFCDGLRARKIVIPEKDILGGVVYSGRIKYHSFPCHSLKLQISSKLRNYYDFRFRAEMTLPVDSSKPLPFCFLRRETTEVMTHFLPGNHPLSAGSSVQMINTDLTSIEIAVGKQRVLKDVPDTPWSGLLR